jgi:Protein of unknown function (DUF3987)
MLRMAWDDGDINVAVKNSRDRVSGAHVSLIGHVTRSELQRRLSAEDITNGFANRLLFCASRRSQLLPRGGRLDTAEVDQLGAELRARIASVASRPGEVPFDPDAGAMFDALYCDGLAEPAPGLLGEVTARGPTQVARLALVYALLDGDDTLRQHHVAAAHAVWLYSVASAAYALGGTVHDSTATRVLEALTAGPGGTELSTADLHAALHGHANGNELKRALRLLEEQGRITHERVPTKGRTRHVWRVLIR